MMCFIKLCYFLALNAIVICSHEPSFGKTRTRDPIFSKKAFKGVQNISISNPYGANYVAKYVEISFKMNNFPSTVH